VLPKESIPFGDAMGMKVAFCNGLAVDLDHVKRMIWVSGQLPFDEDGQLVGKGDIEKQTDQCIKNIDDVLAGLGGTLDDVVQVTVFVKAMGDLKTIHEVRLRYFKEPYPTSTLVEVKGFVHPEALIEINAVAVL
jgi:reactive intermediate/imine deaminase